MTDHAMSQLVVSSPRKIISTVGPLCLFSVSGQQYARAPSKHDSSVDHRSQAWSLATVIEIESPAPRLGYSWLMSTISGYERSDDVWTDDFLDGVLIKSVGHCELSENVSKYLKENTSWHRLRTDCDLEPGPYLFDGVNFSKVCRIFDDTQGAFAVPFWPHVEKGNFVASRVMGERQNCCGVAVPSRLSLKGNTSLSGKMIAVKELFEFKGIPTGLGNRAYLSISEPELSTAPAIQRLIDAGATIVGTTKSSSLLAGEEPTAAIDYQAPWNPRADGFQSPSGSSSGSGAAIAAYYWLDFTIGSDTTGSSRRPALANGVFMVRFSHAAVSADGMKPSFPYANQAVLDLLLQLIIVSRFDAPSVFARSIASIYDFAKVWLGNNENHATAVPTCIKYPTDFFPVDGDHQQNCVQKMVDDMSRTYNIPVHEVSIRKAWQLSPPSEAGSETLEEYLRDVGMNSFIYDFTHNWDIKRFRQAYKQKFHQKPFVNYSTRSRWKLGDQITIEDHEIAMRKLEVYKRWLLKEILEVEKEMALMILPIANVQPNYRDENPGSVRVQEAWDSLWVSPVLGSPEIVVPVGQLEYNSRISGRKEKLPVCVSWVGLPGHDLTLIGAVKRCLQASNRPLNVNVGRRAFGFDRRKAYSFQVERV